LPNLRYDRAIHVSLAADGVTVRYWLELNEWTMVLDGKNLFTPEETKGIVGSRDYAKKYAAKKAPLIADDLRATLDGEPVALKAVKIDIVPEHDHLSFRYTFRGEWSPKRGEKHTFAIEEQNFEDRSATIALTVEDTAEGIEVRTRDVPSAELRAKSSLELKPDEAVKLRRATVTFEVKGPPPVTSPPTAEPVVTLSEEKPPLWEDLTERGLAALFDSVYGLGVMLLLAFAFGAAHAFTPGHGKTLVAAYLVGERGTVRHACILGLATTLAHTGSVILVAVILRAVYGNNVPQVTAAVLKLLGGLLIFGVGLWLFLQRARGRADHVHLFGDHHHHGESEELGAGNAERKNSIVRVILLGIGGGLVPCWDAVLLLLVAITAGKLAAAVPLLVAFSAGLASVLVALGVAVVFAHRAGGKTFGERRWFRMLPVASAVLLLGLGAWFSRDGMQDLIAADRAANWTADRR
jgi:ABC-type nickel/cobalt efflux system permease component RcnA